MTEQEYIDTTNLTRLRIVGVTIRDCCFSLPDYEYVPIIKSIDKLIDSLGMKVGESMQEAADER